MILDRLAYLNALGAEPWSRERNCLWFVRQVRRDLFGCGAVPLVDADLISAPERRQEVFRDHVASGAWCETESPRDGDVAIMTKPHDLHAGIWLVVGRRGLIWHTDIGHNLVSETIMEVTTLRRWKLSFYRHT